MTLEAQDRKELADAMWNVFPSPSDLGRLLTNHFNVNLAAIAANKPRELELYDCVIRRFDGEGLLLKLVDFAAKENAQNELITGIRDKLIQKAELADVQLSDHEIAKRLSGRRLKLSEWKKSFQHTYSLLCGGEFIGRNADLIWLDRWAGLASPDSDTPANSPVVCLHALGGGGKTSLAWEWAIRNEGDGRGFEKVGYLGIFWCSFYNRGYEFEEFLRQSVKFLELEVSDGPTADYSRHEMERLFLDEVERSRYIFVLDGVERKLRAFAGEETKGTDDHAQDDRIERKELERYEMQMLNPEDGRFLRNLTERLYRAKPDQRSLVLLTSRVPPEELTRVGVSGFCCRSLEGFSHDDALLLWQKEGCTAGNAELLQMFTRWGHHPLVIKILALAVKQSPANGDFDKWLSFPENESFDPTNQPVGLSKTSLRQRALDVILHYLDDAGWQVLECISTHPDANPFRFLASVLVTRLKVFPSQRDLWQKLRDLRDCGLVGQLGEGDLSAFDSHPVIRGYVWKRHQNLADEPNRRRRILEAFGEVLKEYNLQDETDIPEEALSIFLMIGWCRLLLDEKKYDEAWKLYRDKARPRLIASQATELDESLLQRWFEASDGHADLTVLPRLTHHGERAEALSYLASHMMVRESRPDCADRLMRFAATEYLLNGDQGKSIGVRQGRMWRVFYEGRLFEAEVELRRLVVAAATAGLPEVAARAAFWTSLVLAMRGQHDEFDRVVEAVRPIVLKYDRRWAIQGFAEGNYYLGRFEDALRELTALEPRPVNEPDPVPGQKAWEHLTAGMAHLHLGHHKESAECLNQALYLSRRSWDRVIEGFATAALAWLHVENGLPAEAVRSIEVNYLSIDWGGKWAPIAAEAFAAWTRANEQLPHPSQRFPGERERTIAEVGLERAFCDGPPFTYWLAYNRLREMIPNDRLDAAINHLHSRLPLDWEKELVPIDELLAALNASTVATSSPAAPDEATLPANPFPTDGKGRNITLRSPSTIGRLQVVLHPDQDLSAHQDDLPTLIAAKEEALNLSPANQKAFQWWAQFKTMNAPIWVHRVCLLLRSMGVNLPEFVDATGEIATTDFQVLVAWVRQNRDREVK